MAYKIEFTKNGWATFCHNVDYLATQVGGFGNAQASRSFVKDYHETIKLLKCNAEGYPISEHPKLKVRNIRKIHFRKLRYKILFHIVDSSTVHVDMVIHDYQDIENIKLD